MSADEAQRLEYSRLMIDGAGHSLTLIDPESLTFVDVSEATSRIFGYTRDELLAGGPRMLSDASDDELRSRYRQAIDAYPEPVFGHVQQVKSDGSFVEFEVIRRAVKAPGRWLIVVTGRDITEERRVRESQERLQAAVAQAGDGLAVIDAETLAYVDANEAIARIAGASREDLLKLGPDAVHRRLGEVTPLREVYAQIVRDAPAVHADEIALVSLDGRRLVLHRMRKAVMIGGRWFIVLNVRDITREKDAEAARERYVEELRRSNEELERFAYAASHDLQEPLRMISSFIELLGRRHGPQLGDEGREFMGYVTSGASRMRRLIDDLLEYSRTGRSSKLDDLVDMKAVFDDVTDNLAQAIEAKGARVEAGTLPTVLSDRTLLTQLLQNLVANALKFSQDGRAPVVRVNCTEDESGWTVTVADNGIGIDAKDFDRIFTIFQRLHAREQYEGTGIGLALCKKIVELHGGRIQVESKPGEGSTFRFTLPRSREAAAR
jgi:PAS domain S-box-containing protein